MDTIPFEKMPVWLVRNGVRTGLRYAIRQSDWTLARTCLEKILPDDGMSWLQWNIPIAIAHDACHLIPLIAKVDHADADTFRKLVATITLSPKNQDAYSLSVSSPFEEQMPIETEQTLYWISRGYFVHERLREWAVGKGCAEDVLDPINRRVAMGGRAEDTKTFVACHVILANREVESPRLGKPVVYQLSDELPLVCFGPEGQVGRDIERRFEKTCLYKYDMDMIHIIRLWREFMYERVPLTKLHPDSRYYRKRLETNTIYQDYSAHDMWALWKKSLKHDITECIRYVIEEEIRQWNLSVPSQRP